MNSACHFITNYEDYDYNNITPEDKSYLGAFSEVISKINNETEKILNMESYFSYIPSSIYDKHTLTNDENPDKSLLIGCVLKSKFDDYGNSSFPLDLLIAIDISGSMQGQNLEVAKYASQRLIESLLLTIDHVGIVYFNNNSHTLFSLKPKSEITPNDYQSILNLEANGGTTISSIINLTLEIYQIHNEKHRFNSLQRRIKRLLLLTDLEDSANDKELINGILNLSNKDIYTTIVGIGQNANLLLAEKVSKAVGFNYIACFNKKDIDFCLIEKYKFLFFPIAVDISLDLKSSQVELVDVYGTNFEKEVLYIKNEFGLGSVKMYSPLVKSSIMSLLFYFKRKYSRTHKPIIMKFIHFLSKSETEVNVCKIASCTATEKIENNRQKGKFFLIHTKLKDGCLLKGSHIVNIGFVLKYKDLYGIVYEENIVKNHKINDVNKISEDSNMHNGLCMFYYNKLFREAIERKGNNKKSKFLFGSNVNLLENSDFINDEIDRNVDFDNEQNEKVDDSNEKNQLIIDYKNEFDRKIKLIKKFFSRFENENPDFKRNIFKEIEDFVNK